MEKCLQLTIKQAFHPYKFCLAKNKFITLFYFVIKSEISLKSTENGVNIVVIIALLLFINKIISFMFHINNKKWSNFSFYIVFSSERSVFMRVQSFITNMLIKCDLLVKCNYTSEFLRLLLINYCDKLYQSSNWNNTIKSWNWFCLLVYCLSSRKSFEKYIKTVWITTRH